MTETKSVRLNAAIITGGDAEEDGKVNMARECSNEGWKTLSTAWFETVKEGEARDSTRRNKGGERGKAECVIMEEEYE
jgi:hypothetical protein